MVSDGISLLHSKSLENNIMKRNRYLDWVIRSLRYWTNCRKVAQ